MEAVFTNLRIGMDDLRVRFDPLPDDYKDKFHELHFETRRAGEANWQYLNNMGMNVTEMSITSLMNHEPSDWRDISAGEYEIGIRSVADSSVYEENHVIPPQKITIAVSGESVSDYCAIAVKKQYYMFSGTHIQNDTLYSVELCTNEDGIFFKHTFRSDMSGNTLKVPLFGDRDGEPLSFARLRKVDISNGVNGYTITYSPYNSVSNPIIVQEQGLRK